MNNRKEVSIETFETLDRLYESIEDLANIFYKEDSNLSETPDGKLLLLLNQTLNKDVNKSIKKVIDTYTELKNIREE
tara:strand:+ start:562 stop:792 length:231 start_codon:yes stop_codon:yes gene_type:complete